MQHNRSYRWIYVVILPVLSLLALFYLFVLPALVASGSMEVTPSSLAFAIFLFFQFWLLTAEYTFSSAAQIYNFRRKHLLSIGVTSTVG